MFVVEPNCRDLVRQLRAAPLQPVDKPDGGEKIDPESESRYGHQTAMARYGVMAKPGPSEQPRAGDVSDIHTDPEGCAQWARTQSLRERLAAMEQDEYVQDYAW